MNNVITHCTKKQPRHHLEREREGEREREREREGEREREKRKRERERERGGERGDRETVSLPTRVD